MMVEERVERRREVWEGEREGWEERRRTREEQASQCTSESLLLVQMQVQVQVQMLVVEVVEVMVMVVEVMITSQYFVNSPPWNSLPPALVELGEALPALGLLPALLRGALVGLRVAGDRWQVGARWRVAGGGQVPGAR